VDDDLPFAEQGVLEVEVGWPCMDGRWEGDEKDKEWQ
jgi:hypothetical protein